MKEAVFSDVSEAICGKGAVDIEEKVLLSKLPIPFLLVGHQTVI